MRKPRHVEYGVLAATAAAAVSAAHALLEQVALLLLHM
jgi:hypothetical protein